jgi:transposase-like protein
MEYIDLTTLSQKYSTEESAREFFERMRWPDGAVCPHCGCKNAYKIGQRASAKRHSRPGLYYCRECKDQFTVTEGTVMESSHIPLNKWLLAIYLLGSSKKGMSAHQLHRQLGTTYRSAWFMAHRIRYAMTQEPLRSKLTGTVEADETFIGGRRKPRNDKPTVMSLVQRGGESRSFHLPRRHARLQSLSDKVREHVDSDATVYTDAYTAYAGLDEFFKTHASVNHSRDEWVRGDVHTNTIEGFFSLLKRGIFGIYHHVSEQHLHRYLNEFDYRYSRRKDDDGKRFVDAVRMTQGKRLTYRELPERHETKEAQTGQKPGAAAPGAGS